jgi:hypothetical protein
LLHFERSRPAGRTLAPTARSRENCTDIRDIVFRNMTFANSGGTGGLVCFPNRPCSNITFENVHVAGATSGWACENIASGSWSDVSPPRDTSKSNCNFTNRS